MITYINGFMLDIPRKQYIIPCYSGGRLLCSNITDFMCGVITTNQLIYVIVEIIKYLRIRSIRRRARASHSETRRRRTASSSSTNLSGFASERSDALLPRTKTCERAGRSRDEKNVGADVRVDVGVESPRRRERVRGRFRRR